MRLGNVPEQHVGGNWRLWRSQQALGSGYVSQVCFKSGC